MSTVYIALGSNLGNRAQNLRDAITLLSPKVVVEELSPIYETEPHYITSQPSFYNAVLRAKTDLSPEDMLIFLKGVEEKVGRTATFRNGPRVIDLDIILYDDMHADSPTLSIPHPRMHERTFVLTPLADIAPELMHPILNLSIRDLLRRLPVSRIVRTSIQV